MLKLTIADLKDCLGAMRQLAQWKPNNLKLGYNIGRIWKDYKERLTEADEMEGALYREYGAKEETLANGMIVLNLPKDLAPEKRAEFNTKIAEMREIEVEVWGNKLSFEALEKAGASLSGDELCNLVWLIDDPVEEPAPEHAAAKAA